MLIGIDSDFLEQFSQDTLKALHTTIDCIAGLSNHTTLGLFLP